MKDADIRAENVRLREALHLALRWLPDPAMHEQMSPGARRQLERIRAALTGGDDVSEEG